MNPKDIATLLVEIEKLDRGCACGPGPFPRCPPCAQIDKVKQMARDIIDGAIERLRGRGAGQS